MPFQAMTEEQLSAVFAKLSALFAQLKKDAHLNKMLKDPSDLDAVVKAAREFGLDVSKAEYLSLMLLTLNLSEYDPDDTLSTMCLIDRDGRIISAFPPFPH